MSNPVPAVPPKESPWTQLVVDRVARAAAPANAEAASGAVEEAKPEQVEAAVREVNASLAPHSISLQFEIDPDTEQVIVKVVDQANGVVIRQIPNEEVVRIAKVMGKASGLLVSQQA